MATEEKQAIPGLEKELTCSICTDLLYQPLTLLDCLHTFCGACLREWFQFQATTAKSLHPYTCPSCRASVRDTRPNATVTTLLDMFVQANPGRGKSEEDKKADRAKYKPGDNVLPKLRKREDPAAEEDRRMLEEVQQMSLREVGIPSNTLEPPRERRRRERSSDRSRERSRETRHRDETRRSRSRNPEPSPSTRESVPPRHIEHQSSLRSLLSASELDPAMMEEEIMRQIMEEGLLDDIDLDNIEVGQENEISERIASAYKRRQREKRRERLERRERQARESRNGEPASSPIPPVTNEVRNEPRPTINADEAAPRRRPHGRSESASGTSTPHAQPSSRPPISRPGLIEAANQGGTQTQRIRSSSQGSSRSGLRANRPESLSVTSTRQGSRSTHDLGERPLTSSSTENPRRRMSDNQQRGNVEERQTFRNNLNIHSSSNPNSPRRAGFGVTSESPSTSSAAISSPLSGPAPVTSRRTTDPTHTRTRSANIANTSIVPRTPTDPSLAEPSARASSMVTSTAPTLYLEPSISCNRCGKEHIEYDLHYNCPRCDRGNYNICLNCYRHGKGCNHWFGFGWAAWPRYERMAPQGGYPPDHEHPHVLTGHRYRRPTQPPTTTTTSPRLIQTDENPVLRLEAGVFCEMCFAFANACYWKCDVCNEGAWGFCNGCVNRGRCCTHPLLPVANDEIFNPTPPTTTTTPHSNTDSTTTATSAAGVVSRSSDPTDRPNHLSPPDSSSPPLTPRSASPIHGPGIISIANTIFRPLTFTTKCNVCKYRPIPPSHTRFHCPQCNKGDYDICTSCYHSLVSSGRISSENGMHGWRRCVRGHRMVVVGFEDRDGGQRRVVTRDLVGGLALKEDDAQTRGNAGANSNSSAQRTAGPEWSWRDTDGSIQRSSISPAHALNTNPLHPQQARFPPDGGIGLRVFALWSYYPSEGVSDELMFPKNAEIREAEDINGDWFWGVYAGGKGLFPGNYGRVI